MGTRKFFFPFPISNIEVTNSNYYSAGTCAYYPDFNGDCRADQHAILQTFNNNAITSYNLCDYDHTGDDGDPYTNPKLPVPGTSGGGTGTTATTAPASTTTLPSCHIEEDPDAGIGAYCECSGYAGSLPTLTGLQSPCVYTALPAVTSTTNTAPAGLYTMTDPLRNVEVCPSSSLERIGTVDFTVCAGTTTKTISTLTQAPTPTATTYNATFQASACDGVPPNLSGTPITCPPTEYWWTLYLPNWGAPNSEYFPMVKVSSVTSAVAVAVV